PNHPTICFFTTWECVMPKSIALVSALLASLLLAACASQQPAPEQSAAGVEDRQPAPVAVEGTQVAPVEAGAPIGQYTLEQLKNPNSILSRRSVYFDFDQYLVKGEFQSLLEAHGRLLNANPQVKMLIQGNADDR